MRRLARFAACTFALMAATAAVQAGTPDPYGFDVDIVLSPKAAASLAARHEGLFLFASYAGDPRKDAVKYADEVGRIDLVGHDTEMTVPGRSGPVHFRGPAISTRRLAMIDGPVLVNLNVASARKSSPDNLLACDFIDGKLADVQKAAITLHCGLIDEHPATALKP